MFYYKLNHLKSFVFILLLAFTACVSPENSAVQSEKTFFDLKGFMEHEAQKLSTAKLEKRIKIGDKTESKTFDTPNWTQELLVFSNSDINKTDWTDKYTVENKGNSLVYIANDSTLKTKRLQVDFNDSQNKNFDNIKSLMVINNTRNVLYESSEFLSYYPNDNFTIIRNQRVKTGEDKTIEIKSKVIR